MFIVILIIIFAALVAWILIRMKIGMAERQEDEEREEARKEYERTHKTFTSYVHGLQYKNDDGKIVLDAIIQAARRRVREDGSLYKETRKSDFEEEPGLEVSEFDGVFLDCELEPTKFDGKPAVKVWIQDEDDRIGAGWLPAEDADYISYLLRTFDPITTMIIEGGKTKSLEVTETGDKVVTEETDLFPRVLINYEKDELKK